MTDAAPTDHPPTEPVHARREGPLGRITLDRPAAINALTLPMVRALARALEAFAADDGVTTVVVDGAGDRGLCAGGDVVGLRADLLAGRPSHATFWAEEYALNAAIAAHPKPYVVLADGIVMGGGVGISAHGSHRVVTDRTRWAMPEVGIGFVPDVGGTAVLAGAPGELGTHVALTATHVTGADAVALGAADAVVDHTELDRLVADLHDRPPDEAIAAAVARSAVPAPSQLAAARTWIDEAYAGDDAAAILGRLRARSEPAAREAADRIASRSPTAVAVTLAALRRAAALPDLEAVLAQELRTSCLVAELPDFVEGIRAVLVDRDGAPRWRPARLDEVDPAVVRRCIGPSA